MRKTLTLLSIVCLIALTGCQKSQVAPWTEGEDVTVVTPEFRSANVDPATGQLPIIETNPSDTTSPSTPTTDNAGTPQKIPNEQQQQEQQEQQTSEGQQDQTQQTQQAPKPSGRVVYVSGKPVPLPADADIYDPLIPSGNYTSTTTGEVKPLVPEKETVVHYPTGVAEVVAGKHTTPTGLDFKVPQTEQQEVTVINEDPDGSYSYRFEANGSAVVDITDQTLEFARIKTDDDLFQRMATPSVQRNIIYKGKTAFISELEGDGILYYFFCGNVGTDYIEVTYSDSADKKIFDEFMNYIKSNGWLTSSEVSEAYKSARERSKTL